MYIRTKDWIYDTDNLHYRFIENNKVYEVGWDVEKPTFVADIIKQSENLEELCDEFVLIEPRDDGGKKYSHRDKESFIRDYIGYEHIDIVLSYYTIYGAIWTSKGLIYVAKMDNDGKLVLI